MECANHPGREGLLRCNDCGKYFCDACAEGTEDHAYCYNCLRNIAVKSRRVKRGKMNAPIVAGALVSAALGLLVLAGNSWLLTLPLFGFPPQLADLIAFISTFGALRIGFAFAVMFGYFTLAVGLISDKRWSVYFGLALNAALFCYEYCGLRQGFLAFDDQFVAIILMLAFISFVIVRNWKEIGR